MPSRDESTMNIANEFAHTIATKATPCNNIPRNNRFLLQNLSAREPVKSWPTPHTAGYVATIIPTSARSKPFDANNNGNNPHTIPSFKLLTSPACVTDPKFLCFQVVSQNTF